MCSDHQDRPLLLMHRHPMVFFTLTFLTQTAVKTVLEEKKPSRRDQKLWKFWKEGHKF